MKDSIREYIDLTPKEKKELWENATFVFDANVLLNLYRYSNITRDILIGALNNFSDCIWIPHQVAYEFMKNRCEVIYDVINKYDSFEIKKEEFLANVKSLSNLQDRDEEIIKLKTVIDESLQKLRSTNLRVTSPDEDEILKHILSLFEGKTGTAYSKECIVQLKKEGGIRFAEKTPPGYEDSTKKHLVHVITMLLAICLYGSRL